MPTPSDPRFSLIDQAGPSPIPAADLSTGRPEDPRLEFIDSGGAPGDRLAISTRYGLVADPNRAGRILQLQARTRLPGDLIDRNLEDVEKEAKLATFDPVAFRKSSPIVAKWLAEQPEHAAVASDDLEKLAALEQAVRDVPDYRYGPRGEIIGPRTETGLAKEYRTPVELFREIHQQAQVDLATVADQNASAAALQQRFGPLAGIVAGMAAAIASDQRALGIKNVDTQHAAADITAASQTIAPGFWGDIQRGAGGLAADMPLMLSGGAIVQGAKSLVGMKNIATVLAKTGLGGAGKRLALGAAGTALAVQPLALREGINAGQDNGWSNGLAAWGIETAIPAAFGATGTEHAVLTALGTRGVPKEVAGGFGQAAAGLLKHTGLEATEESVTELAHALHEYAAGIDPHALDQDALWRRLAVAGTLGGAAGAGFNAPETMALAALAKRSGPNAHATLARVQASLQGSQLIESLAQVAEDSQAAKRAPDATRTLFQAISDSKVGTVYLDPEAWATYAQGRGMDPRAAAAQHLGDAKVYDEAARTGAPLAIPTATFAFLAADKAARAHLVNEARMDPQAANAREALDELAKVENDTTADPASAAQQTAAQATEAVQADLAQQLQAAGYSPDAAALNAKQMATAFRVMAARTSQPGKVRTAKDIANEWQVSINRPLPDILTRPQQLSPDQLFSRLDAKRRADALVAGDAKIAAQDAEATAKRNQEREALAKQAAGPEGDAIIQKAIDRLRASPVPLSYSDAMAWLGRDFGFQADARAEMSPEARVAGNLLSAALRSRGADLRALMDDAGNAKANPVATTAKAAAAPIKPDDAKLHLAAMRLRSLVAALQAGRADLSEMDQAAALAAEVAPHIDELAMDQTARDEVRRAVEFAQEGTTLNQERSDLIGQPASALASIAWPSTAWPAPRLDGTNPGAAFAAFERDVVGKTIALPTGQSITIRPVDFFRFTCQTPKDGSRKGHVAKASSSSDALAMLRDGKLAPDDIAGYQPDRAASLLVIPDLLGKPDFIVEQPSASGPKPELIAMKHYGGALVGFAVTWEPEAGRAGIKSLHFKRQKDLKNARGKVLWSRNSSPQAHPDEPGALLTGGEAGANPAPSTGESVSGQDATGKTLGQPSYNGRRGSITFRNTDTGRRAEINLFHAADLSTFIHESGHLYLELMGAEAAKAEAPQDIKDDWQTIAKWLGVERIDQVETPHHEQFARGFEAYMREGKAPSNELRGAFARFRAWLVSIYKNVRALAVDVPPDVRQVFDRLLATQEEIAASTKAIGDLPVEDMAKAIGMDPARLKALYDAANQEAEDELVQQFMDEERRHRAAAYKELRDEVLTEIEADVNRRPVYVAASVLRRGTLPGGAPLPNPSMAVKLDAGQTNALLAMRAGHDGKIRQADRKRLAMMVAKDGGVSPDEAAALFGFQNGDELIGALTTAPNRADIIQAETDRVMRERHGDLLTDGTIAEKAMRAVHNEARAELHLAILKAMATRTGQKAAPIEVLRAAAQQKIAGTLVRDLTPGIYLNAEKKAARLAHEAAVKGDLEAALTHKRRELLNHELYVAAAEAKESATKAADYLRTFADSKVRERIGKAGGWTWTVTYPDGTTATVNADDTTTAAQAEDKARALAATRPGATFARSNGYLEAIDNLLATYAFNRATNASLDAGANLLAWVDAQRTAGNPVDIDPALILNAQRINWRQMTVEQLAGLRDSVEHIARMASLKNKMSRLQRQRDFAALRSELTTTLERTHRRVLEPKAEGKKTALDKVEDFWTAHRRASYIAREMDGGEDGGAWWSAVVRPMNEAADAEVTMLGEAQAKQVAMWEKWEAATTRDAWKPNQVRQFAGFKKGLTRLQAIMVALNWGNEGNRQRLLDGHNVTTAQVEAVLDALGSADWNLVESVWEHVDSYWSEIAALEQRVTGVAPEKVEASPFPTRHGTIRGGYFPVVYNNQAAALRIDGDAAEWAKQLQAQAYSRAVTRHGHTQARTGGLGKPLSLDPGVIGRHLTLVIHDLTHREAIADAAKILADDTIATAIHDRMGKPTLSTLKQWVADIATAGRPPDAVAAGAAWLRRGFSMASMAWRPITAVIQLSGFANAVPRVGAGRMAKSIAGLFGSPDGVANAFAFVDAKSKAMRGRAHTQTQEMNEALTSLQNSTVANAQRAMTKYGYWMMAQVQRTVDTATWLAAWDKAQDEGRSEADAIAIADQTVIDTQSSGLTKDLSGVQRSPTGQLLTAAYTYGAMSFNQLNEIRGEFWKNSDSARAYGKAASGVFFALLLPTAMTMVLRGLARGFSDDDKKHPKTAYFAELASAVLGTMVIARELGGAVQGFGNYKGPAGLQPVESIGRLMTQIGQGDMDKGLAKAIADSMGGALGLPSGQAWAMGTGLLDFLDHPSPDIRPLIFGLPPKK